MAMAHAQRNAAVTGVCCEPVVQTYIITFPTIKVDPVSCSWFGAG